MLEFANYLNELQMAIIESFELEVRTIYTIGLGNMFKNTLQKYEVFSPLKYTREMPQNLPYFWNTKTHIGFFVFRFMQL